MKRVLSKLREQSDGAKTHIAIVSAIVVTFGILALWIATLPKTLVSNTGGNSASVTKAPGPLRALINSISHAAKAIPKPSGGLSSAEPSISVDSNNSPDTGVTTSFDESQPASSDIYQGEQVFTEDEVAPPA